MEFVIAFNFFQIGMIVVCTFTPLSPMSVLVIFHPCRDGDKGWLMGAHAPTDMSLKPPVIEGSSRGAPIVAVGGGGTTSLCKELFEPLTCLRTRPTILA